MHWFKMTKQSIILLFVIKSTNVLLPPNLCAALTSQSDKCYPFQKKKKKLSDLDKENDTKWGNIPKIW